MASTKKKNRYRNMKNVYISVTVLTFLVLTGFIYSYIFKSKNESIPPQTTAPEASEQFSVYYGKSFLTDAENRTQSYPFNTKAKTKLMEVADKVLSTGDTQDNNLFGKDYAALYLAHAYLITKDTKYANKSVEVLKSRVFEKEPILYNNSTDYSLAGANEVLTRSQRLSFWSQTYTLLEGYGGNGWSTSDKDRVKTWLRSFGTHLKDRYKTGTCYTNAKLFYLEGIAASGVATGDMSLFNHAVNTYKQALQTFTCGGNRVIDGNGFWGHEMMRVTAGDDTWYYAGYSMIAAVHIAEIARTQGVDLYNWSTSDGRSLKKALDTHVPYLTGSAWPQSGGRISYPTFHREFIHSYEMAYAYLRNSAYTNVLTKAGDRRITEKADRIGPVGYLYANSKTTLGSSTSTQPNPTNILSSPVPTNTPSYPSVITYQKWNSLNTQTNAVLTTLTSDPRYPSSPSSTSLLSTFEVPFHSGTSINDNNFGSRMYALLIPPESTNYTFYLSADDSAELLLSSSQDPVNVRSIANVTRWVYYRDYACTKSDSSNCSVNMMKSAPVFLTQGTRYYIELRHIDSIGEDHASVFWSGGSITNPTIINGNNLQKYEAAPPSTPNPSTCQFGKYTVPGKVEAENYMCGGQGVAFNDTTSSNEGGQYRIASGEAVDVQRTGDTDGGYNVAYTRSGEWIKYGLNVLQQGKYTINVRVASLYSTGKFRLRIDGVDVSGQKSVAQTGAWQTYTTTSIPGVQLQSGEHTLELSIEGDSANYNYFDFVYAGATTSPQSVTIMPKPSPSPTPISSSSTNTISIRATGTAAKNASGVMEYPRIHLKLNGVRVRDWYVNGTFSDYQYQTSNQISNLEIEYSNDADNDSANDRNLRVDYVSVNGNIYQTEASSTYSVGSYSSSNGCGGGYKSSEWLHCGGAYFRFAL